MVLLAVMPLGMTIAHRSSPLFLGLSAAFALGALVIEGGFGVFIQEARRALSTPIGLAVLSFAGWSFLSLGWSEVRETSVPVLFEFWLPVAFAFTLSLTLARRMTEGAFWTLAIAVVVAQLVMLLDLRTGLEIRKALGMRFDSYILNRPSLTLMVLLPPILAWFYRSVGNGTVLGLAFLALVGLAVANSDSGSAVLGLLVAALACVVALLAPRLSILLAKIVIVAALAIAPVIGPLADRLIPNSVHQHMASNHSRDRVNIWLSFDAAIHEDPILGAGFGASARLGETSIAQRVPPERRVLLDVGHPHNAVLQIWVELGLIGALLAGAVCFLTLDAVARQSRVITALGLALMASAVAVAIIGHGAWQGWWVSALGASIVWLLAAKHRHA